MTPRQACEGMTTNPYWKKQHRALSDLYYWYSTNKITQTIPCWPTIVPQSQLSDVQKIAKQPNNKLFTVHQIRLRPEVKQNTTLETVCYSPKERILPNVTQMNLRFHPWPITRLKAKTDETEAEIRWLPSYRSRNAHWKLSWEGPPIWMMSLVLKMASDGNEKKVDDEDKPTN